jgi:hypothetical protein
MKIPENIKQELKPIYDEFISSKRFLTITFEKFCVAYRIMQVFQECEISNYYEAQSVLKEAEDFAKLIGYEFPLTY